MNRPTVPLHQWESEPKMAAGQDSLKGGTWLGVNEESRVALVTNLRKAGVGTHEKKSRGELPLLYLQNRVADLPQYLKDSGNDYGPVNLLWGDIEKLFYWNSERNDVESVGFGIHGLANAKLDTPWHKVERGKKALQNLVDSDRVSPKHLFGLLNDDTQADPEDLPVTSLPRELERAYSSIRIPPYRGYGSVSGSVVLMDSHGAVTLWEKSYRTGEVREERFGRI